MIVDCKIIFEIQVVSVLASNIADLRPLTFRCVILEVP